MQRIIAPCWDSSLYLFFRQHCDSAISTGLMDVLIPVPYGVWIVRYLGIAIAITAFLPAASLCWFSCIEINSARKHLTPQVLSKLCCLAVGIAEESATGSSSGALACYFESVLWLSFMRCLSKAVPMQMSSRYSDAIIFLVN